MLTPSPSQLKLIELLKTDEQVCGLIEKLTFGCRIKLIYDSDIEVKEYIHTLNNSIQSEQIRLMIEGKIDYDSNLLSKKIIGLPLSEHFIRLYCENNKITCTFNRNEIMIGTFYPKNTMTIIVTDYEKDFNSQSDECYNSICEALINL